MKKLFCGLLFATSSVSKRCLRFDGVTRDRAWRGLALLFSLSSSDCEPEAQLFQESLLLRSSRQFYDLLNFVRKFRKYSMFNNMLVYTQNPNVTYYATPGHWRKEFGRTIKDGVRPMVILAPKTPVLFVYDLADTEGELPVYFQDPFTTKGHLPPGILERTVDNCLERDKINVRFTEKSFLNAGCAIRHYVFLKTPESSTKVEIEISDKLGRGSIYQTLAHELAHIYLGHIGNDKDEWWPDRRKLSKEQKELEAEATSFLVLSRAGLQSKSAEYLSIFLKHENDLHRISLDRIIKTATLIEKMGSRRMPPRKGDKTQPKKKAGQEWAFIGPHEFCLTSLTGGDHSMRKKQRTIVLLGTAIIGFMGLYPPFSLVVYHQTLGGEQFLGYGFILDPPKHKVDGVLTNIKIDAERLGVQWTLVILLVIGLSLAAKTSSARSVGTRSPNPGG